MLMRTRPTGFTESVVYEDENVVAFLDKFPMRPGHTLVVPKQQVELLHELSEEQAAALAKATLRVARKVMAGTGASAYNVLQNNGKTAGQIIPHVHFHVIPRATDDGIRFEAPSEDRPGPLPDTAFDGELATLRDAIRSSE